MTLTFPTIRLSSLIAQWRHAARSHPLSLPGPQPQSFTDADQARADQARRGSRVPDGHAGQKTHRLITANMA